MFKREHHQIIHSILSAIDSTLLQECGAAFDGGTLISLLNGEFRLSKDIDFICPVGPGYKKLRSITFNANALDKAEQAQPCVEPLRRSISRFLNDEKYQAKCFSALKMQATSLAIDGIKKLDQDFRP